MRFLEYLKKLVRDDNRGGIPNHRKSDSERLMEIELLIKTKPSCPRAKALEDLYEINARREKHYKDLLEGYDKGR